MSCMIASPSCSTRSTSKDKRFPASTPHCPVSSLPFIITHIVYPRFHVCHSGGKPVLSRIRSAMRNASSSAWLPLSRGSQAVT